MAFFQTELGIFSDQIYLVIRTPITNKGSFVLHSNRRCRL